MLAEDLFRFARDENTACYVLELEGITSNVLMISMLESSDFCTALEDGICFLGNSSDSSCAENLLLRPAFVAQMQVLVLDDQEAKVQRCVFFVAHGKRGKQQVEVLGM